jgi:peptide subunit release factor 1 (eRF1)
MKYLIMFIVTSLLFSCTKQKDRLYCWECHLVSTFAPMDTAYNQKNKVCDKSQNEIDKIQSEGTYSTLSITGEKQDRIVSCTKL